MNYKVYLSTKVNPAKLEEGSGLMVLEPDDYSEKEIKAIKKKGYKVLGYLSVGTIEKERPWYKTYSKYALKTLEDWPNEKYADVRKTNWRVFLINRAKAIKKKGFDGWWCDNLDVYEYYKSTKMFAACGSVLRQIKALGGYLMVNGGSEFWDTAIDKKANLKITVSGVTQEEVFSLIKSYKGKGTFGKQKKPEGDFYKKLLKKLMNRGVGAFLLEYTRDEAVKKSIKNWCKENGASYYISEDVNL